MSETIKGYIRYEPELRFTSGAVGICNFTLYDTPEKDYKVKTPVVTWEHLAELCSQKLAVGDELYLKGYFKERRWLNKEGKEVIQNQFTAQQVWIVEGGEPQEINVESYRDAWKVI